jgi:hypothetical protein
LSIRSVSSARDLQAEDEQLRKRVMQQVSLGFDDYL